MTSEKCKSFLLLLSENKLVVPLMNRIDVKRIVLLVFLVFSVFVTFAQVSDEQVVTMLKEAHQQGIGQEDVLFRLTQKGVTQEQLLRIKANYERETRGDSVTYSTTSSRRRMEIPLLQDTVVVDRLGENEGPQIFGHEIFNNRLLTFEPNLNIATPENYILGPGDEVIIDIWGDSQQTLRQEISPDGTLTDPQIGPIVLNGLSVKEANSRLKNAYSRIYSAMNGENPTTFMKMSLGEIRSIRVNVMGEVVMPGTYTLPSLASLFHALYNAGGVNDIGSLRSVKVSRAGCVIADVDVYQYLLKGKCDLDIRLEDGDVVLVSPYQNLISIEGKVKRPLFYEMKDDESVADILEYCGGFTGDAYKKAIRIIRKSGSEYRVYNVDKPQFTSFALMDGDEITVDSVLNRFENKVEIRGAVFRPGLYAIDNNNVSTIKQLIEKAEGIREDAFLNRALLYREKADLSQEILPINLVHLLQGIENDIVLHKNDVLYIPSVFDLQEEYTVTIRGAVGNPGIFSYAEGMTIEDLIIRAGGLLESASVVKVDVARRIKNSKSLEVSSSFSENFTLTLKDGFVVDNGECFVLQPFDEVYVRQSPGYQKQQNVLVRGEVLFEGEYALSKKNERLSDLVKKAGGITPEAFIDGARLIRKMDEAEIARVESLLNLTQRGSRDSIDAKTLGIGDSTYYVGIELAEALENPGKEVDVVLREGDMLYVPQYNGTVKISGAVMYPNTVVYKENAKLKHYIEQGGGFAERAKKKRVFIVYMNGTVAKSKGWAKSNIVAPGCEIIVPMKSMRRRTSLAEIMSLASSTTSIAALVTSIINNTK